MAALGTKMENLTVEESCDLLKEIFHRRSAENLEFYLKKNYKARSEMHTEDCMFCPPGMPPRNGREEFARFTEKYDNEGVGGVSYEDVEMLYSGGEMAAGDGTYRFFDKDGKEFDHGKILFMWKRIKGEWLVHLNIFNSDVAIKDPAPLTVVTERLKELDSYWNAGDFKALSSMYTPDCKMFPPRVPLCVGREEVEKYCKEDFNSGSVWIETVCTEAHKIGDNLIYEHGPWTLYDHSGMKLDHGHALAIWKRLADGKWHIHRDAFNSEVHF